MVRYFAVKEGLPNLWKAIVVVAVKTNYFDFARKFAMFEFLRVGRVKGLPPTPSSRILSKVRNTHFESLRTAGHCCKYVVRVHRAQD